MQKCADLNQMSTKNLSLLFAPSLFQTDGKGEHEVKVMEDLIDNYVSIFNVSRGLQPLPAGAAPDPLGSPRPAQLCLPLVAVSSSRVLLLTDPVPPSSGRLMRTRYPRWIWRTA